VLPAGRTRLFIVPELRDQGYTVTYTEFDGGHGVTKALMGEATAWLAAARP
jgi:predicted esterase